MDTNNLKNSAPLIAVAVLMVAVIALAGSFALNRVKSDAADTGAMDQSMETSDGRSGGWWSEDVAITIPAGTRMAVRLGETLSTKTTTAGEQFMARVVSPVVIDGETVIPAGATVSGRVVEATPSKRIGGRARLSLQLTSVNVGGESYPLSASSTLLGKKTAGKDAATIGGATAGGALLGRILGHRRGDEAEGTLVGAVVGGAVGTGVAASNRGHAILPAGTTIRVALDAPTTV